MNRPPSKQDDRRPRVVVLGALGMLGHKIVQRLAPRMTIIGMVRSVDRQAGALAELTGAEMLGGLDALHPDRAAAALRELMPAVVVNCVGVIKQRGAKTTPEEMVRINALFPHVLARECNAMGARLIHLSTDCVFSGDRGNYTESDSADPVDAYGCSKLLGEVDGDGAVTIRTSMIGRELRGFHSLLEWFLRQDGRPVRGFRCAIFSGLTNIALADEIGRLITQYPDVRGLYHVSAAPIAKHALLEALARAYDLGVDLTPDDTLHCDRSLRSQAYQRVTGFAPPSWPTMISELAADTTPYQRLQALA